MSIKNVTSIWALSGENLSHGGGGVASAQSDQRLCYSLFEEFHMKTYHG